MRSSTDGRTGFFSEPAPPVREDMVQVSADLKECVVLNETGAKLTAYPSIEGDKFTLRFDFEGELTQFTEAGRRAAMPGFSHARPSFFPSGRQCGS